MEPATGSREEKNNDRDIELNIEQAIRWDNLSRTSKADISDFPSSQVVLDSPHLDLSTRQNLLDLASMKELRESETSEQRNAVLAKQRQFNAKTSDDHVIANIAKLNIRIVEKQIEVRETSEAPEAPTSEAPDRLKDDLLNNRIKYGSEIIDEQIEKGRIQPIEVSAGLSEGTTNITDIFKESTTAIEKGLKDQVTLNQVLESLDNQKDITKEKKGLLRKYWWMWVGFIFLAIFNLSLLVRVIIVSYPFNTSTNWVSFQNLGLFITLIILISGVYQMKVKRGEIEKRFETISAIDFENYASTLHTFNSYKGMIRLLLILLLLAALFFSSQNETDTTQIPITIIMSLNAILLYYGIKPESVLPTNLLYQEEEEDKKVTGELLIDSFPKLKSLISDIRNKFAEIRKISKETSEKIKNQGKLAFNKLRLEAQSISDKGEMLRLRFEEKSLELQNTIKTTFTESTQTLDNISKGLQLIQTPKNINTKSDMIGLGVLSISLTWFMMKNPISSDETTLQLVFGTSAVFLGYLAGIILSRLSFSSRGTSATNTLTDLLSSKLQSFTQVFQGQQEDLENFMNSAIGILEFGDDKINDLKIHIDEIEKRFNTTIDFISKKVDQQFIEIEKKFNDFYNENPLRTLRPELSIIIVLISIVLLFGAYTFNLLVEFELLYMGLNLLTLAYFVSKSDAKDIEADTPLKKEK